MCPNNIVDNATQLNTCISQYQTMPSSHSEHVHVHDCTAALWSATVLVGLYPLCISDSIETFKQSSHS